METSTRQYIDNVLLGHEQITNTHIGSEISKLFRPPYGKIKSQQARLLKKWGTK